MLQTNYTPKLLGLQGVEIIKAKKTDKSQDIGYAFPKKYNIVKLL